MEESIRLAGLGLTALVAIYAFHRRSDLIVLVFASLGALSYFAYSIGFVLTPAKVIGLFALLYVFVNLPLVNLLGGHHLRPFFLYILYTVYLTLFMSMFWPEAEVSKQSFLYGSTMRGLVQIFQAIMGVAIVLVIVSRVKHPLTLYRLQVVLLATFVLVSIYGIYVWYAQRAGLPFNPITRQGGEGSKLDYIIATTVDGVRMVRAYSLTGEPKALAINAVVGLVLTYFTVGRDWWLFRGMKGELFLAPLFLITLYLTFSTAGFLILPVILLSALFVVVRVGFLGVAMMGRLIVLSGLAVLAIHFTDYDVGGKITTVLSDRVEERIEGSSNGLFTYAEASILRMWDDRPELTISGVGLGGSSFYVRLYDNESYEGYTAAPRGIIGFVSDQGLIGLSIFLFAVFRSSRKILQVACSHSAYRRVFAGALVISLANVVTLFSYSQWYVMWLTIGLLVSAAILAEQELRNLRTAQPLNRARFPRPTALPGIGAHPQYYRNNR